MKHQNWFICVIAIVIVYSDLVASKRSFSIGRSRSKSAKINVRRKGATPDAPRPAAPVGPEVPAHQPHPNPIGWNANNHNSPLGGAPPAYPGLGHMPAAAHGAPPPYSSGLGNPPSYASVMGSQSQHISKIPARGSPGYSDRTVFHGVGYGPNVHGTPSHTSGLYNNHGMGGFSGVGTYGSNYGYGNRSPFSFGNILTGLALWNVARSFNSHNRPQHIYIHNNSTNTAVENANITAESAGLPIVSTTTMASVTDFQSIPENPPSSTPVPSEYEYTTIHPSLLIYAIGSPSLKEIEIVEIQVPSNN